MYKSRKLPNTRIDVADALRGIAVAGIILKDVRGQVSDTTINNSMFISYIFIIPKLIQSNKGVPHIVRIPEL